MAIVFLICTIHTNQILLPKCRNYDLPSVGWVFSTSYFVPKEIKKVNFFLLNHELSFLTIWNNISQCYHLLINATSYANWQHIYIFPILFFHFFFFLVDIHYDHMLFKCNWLGIMSLASCHLVPKVLNLL